MTNLSATPLFLVGRFISSCIVQAIDLASDGTWSTVSDTSGDIASTGYMDTVAVQRARTLEQIQPINALFDNFVPLAAGWTATVNEIRASDGSSYLDAISGSYNYVLMTMQITEAGEDAATFTEAFIGVIEGTEKTYSPGKHVTSMTVRPIGIPNYAGTATTTPFAS